MTSTVDTFRRCWRDLRTNGGNPSEIIAAPDVFQRYRDELVVTEREGAAGTKPETPAPLIWKNLTVCSDDRVPQGTFYMK